MAGNFTQALQNVLDAEQHIKAIAGLPANAQAVQVGVAALIADAVPKIKSEQTLTLAFVPTAQKQLQLAETQLSGDTPLPQIKATIESVQTAAKALKSEVDSITGGAHNFIAKADEYTQQLATIESQLNAQIVAQQAQLRSLQSQEASARSHYYYLIALGPFGLVGLVAALILYQNMQSQVNSLQAQVNAQAAQLSRLKSMAVVTTQMHADLSALDTCLSSINNAVTILCADIVVIIEDTEQTDKTRAVIKVYVIAAKQTVDTLGVDAS